MRIAKPLISLGLLSRTLRVGESEAIAIPASLTQSGLGALSGLPNATPLALSVGVKLSVPWLLKLPDPLAVTLPAALLAKPPKYPATPVTLAHVTKNVGIGLGLGSTTLTLMPLAHATTTAELSARLTGYGFPPVTSQSIAQQGLDFARSHAGQLTTIFLAGSAVGIGVVEAVRPDWSWTRKILAASIFGMALLGLASWGSYKGWWGYDAAQKAESAVKFVKKSPPLAP